MQALCVGGPNYSEQPVNITLKVNHHFKKAMHNYGILKVVHFNFSTSCDLN